MSKRCTSPSFIVKKNYSILATPERQKKNGGVVREYEPETPNSRVMVVHHKARVECQLDRCLRMSWIDKPEYEAGIKFRSAFMIYAEGVRGKDSTQALMIDGRGCAMTDAERRDRAKHVVDDAYSVVCPLDRSILRRVCGFDERIFKEESHKLHRSLDALARHWKIG